MARHGRAVARAVLLVAAVSSAGSAGGSSCGREEVCAAEDVEAVEEASMDRGWSSFSRGVSFCQPLDQRGKRTPTAASASQEARAPTPQSTRTT
ncbi:unnamed protein product [Prorocentrum cordatum]|uniref:Secreted protein n=1 Tax=Prorocentrum cordatum TaxID=2364126 RepID=A0ABN9WGM4_9DINO|nr:unnamed protein product [Polarella glacialis]